GKQVTWGIPATAKTAANALVEGIVQTFKASRGSADEEVVDEDGDLVSSITHGHFNMLDIAIKVTDTAPEMPEMNDRITGLGIIDGINFSPGQVLVKTADITRTGAASADVSIQAKHYPYMP